MNFKYNKIVKKFATKLLLLSLFKNTHDTNPTDLTINNFKNYNLVSFSKNKMIIRQNI